MRLRFYFEKILQILADAIFTIVPQSTPSSESLENCKIVSHRGEHDNRHIKENTLVAFDRACQQGIWGIEFDIQWTRDLQPVVIHDANCARVFGIDLTVNKIMFDELRRKVPEVPSLAEVIQRYGGKVHMMIELKSETISNVALHRACLHDLLDDSCLLS